MVKESGNGAGGGAYEGLKVVDFSQGIAGPYCAQILRQHGARVTPALDMQAMTCISSGRG